MHPPGGGAAAVRSEGMVCSNRAGPMSQCTTIRRLGDQQAVLLQCITLRAPAGLDVMLASSGGASSPFLLQMAEASNSVLASANSSFGYLSSRRCTQSAHWSPIQEF